MADHSDDGAGGGRISTHESSSNLIGHVTAFARDLRAEGADVPANVGIDATRAIGIVGLADRSRAKAALRATLISRERDLEAFDRLFPTFWQRILEGFGEPRDRESLTPFVDNASRSPDQEADVEAPGGDDRDAGTAHVDPGTDDPPLDPKGRTESPGAAPGPDDANEVGPAVDSSTYSQVGQPSPIEVCRVGGDDALGRAVDELTRAIGNRKGRRWAPTTRGNRIDTRRALRRSFGSGGTVPEVPLQARQRSTVRVVIMVDVSQSVLDTIDRGFLLRFLRSMYDAWRNVRIFFFDTNVREVTERFAVQTTEEAVHALQQAEAEWGGGTRIGHAFATVREDHPYVIDRETTVFVISDGLEVGEVDQLEAEMANVSRRSTAVFWLNPLAASADYAPTCRGMAASLPYVNGLFAFADAADVEEIARQVSLRGTGGSIGYEYDRRNRVFHPGTTARGEREH